MNMLQKNVSTEDLKKKTLSQTQFLQVSFAKDTKDHEKDKKEKHDLMATMKKE